MGVVQQIPIGEILELLGNALDAQISYVGADLRYRYANDNYHIWTSRPSVTLRGKSMAETLGRSDFALIKPYVDAALSGERSEFELERRHPTAGVRTIMGRIEPNCQPDGAISGFLEILRDVTDSRRRELANLAKRDAQRKFERTLFASEKRFRTMIEQSPLSVQIFSAAGTCVHANDAWKQLWRAEPEDLETYNIFSDLQFVELGILPLMKRAFEGEIVEIAAFEYDPLKSGLHGRVRWVSALLYPILTHEDKQETVLVLQDVTEERQAQIDLQETKERLEMIVDTSMDAIVTIDETHRITGWEGQSEEIFGWSRDQALGQNLFETIIPDAIRTGESRPLARYLKEGGRPALNRRFELEVQHKNGHQFPAELAVTSARYQGQLFFTVVTRDISERVRSRKELQTLNSQLEARVSERTDELRRANRELQDAYHKLETFSYSVAHDFRNPLRRLAAIASIVGEDDADPQERKQNLALIKGFVTDMTRLIEDHLAFAKFAHAELRLDSIEFSALAWSVARDVQEHYPGLEVRVRILPNLKVTADPLLLRVVLESLLDNAAKFSQKSPAPTVEIGTATQLGERIYYVKDNGVGFDTEFSHKIFKPFERLHREEDYAGSGIGLSNASEVIQRHGGRIWANSVPGKGATFSFTLGPSAREPQ